MLRKYSVQGYFQGHRHTMEHNQESGANGPNDLSFFLIGAGALLDWGSMKNHLLDTPPLVNNACLSGNPAGHRAHCHFYWYTKTFTGGYGQITTSPEGVLVEYIESDVDRVMYSYTVPPRSK